MCHPGPEEGDHDRSVHLHQNASQGQANLIFVDKVRYKSSRSFWEISNETHPTLMDKLAQGQAYTPNAAENKLKRIKLDMKLYELCDFKQMTGLHHQYQSQWLASVYGVAWRIKDHTKSCVAVRLFATIVGLEAWRDARSVSFSTSFGNEAFHTIHTRPPCTTFIKRITQSRTKTGLLTLFN